MLWLDPGSKWDRGSLNWADCQHLVQCIENRTCFMNRAGSGDRRRGGTCRVGNQSEWCNEVRSFVFATADNTITFGGTSHLRPGACAPARAKALGEEVRVLPGGEPVLRSQCIREADDDKLSGDRVLPARRLGKTGARMWIRGITTSSLKAFTVVDPVSMAKRGCQLARQLPISHIWKAIAAKWQQHDDHALVGYAAVLQHAKIGSRSASHRPRYLMRHPVQTLRCNSPVTR